MTATQRRRIVRRPEVRQVQVRRRSFSVAAVTLLVLSTLALVAPAAQAATGTNPTVIAGTKAGPLNVHGGSVLGTVGTLSVPKGSWFVIAKLVVQDLVDVTRAECQLIAGTDLDKARANPSTVSADRYHPMLLTITHTFAAAGSVRLRCYSDGTTGDVVARDISMTAMKAGRLTDSNGTVGSGSPRVISTIDDSGKAIPGTLAYTDIGQLVLPAGAWWIVAKAWVLPLDIDGLVELDCELVAGGDADVAALTLQPDFAQSSIGLQVVHATAVPDAAHVLCRATQGTGFFGIRITAVKAGKLTNMVLGGASASVGSGAPRVISGFGDGPYGVAPGSAYVSLGTLPLAKGAWAVFAKLYTIGSGGTASAECRLALGSDKDHTALNTDGTYAYDWLPLLRTHTFTSAGQANVLCRTSGGLNQSGAHFLKITGIKLGKLTRQDL